MRNLAIKVKFNLDPGRTSSFFAKSRDQARSAFHEVFPNSCEYDSAHFFTPASTTLNIVLSGISIGAGIVAAEILKECGKDLWKASKKLILPKAKQVRPESLPPHNKDTLRLEIRIGDQSVFETLSGLDQNSETRVKKFLITAPIRMYEAYCSNRNSKPST